MLKIILKDNIAEKKINALLEFLKLIKIDAELKGVRSLIIKKKVDFSLSTGIWKDYKISGRKLRAQAWLGQVKS